jgi:hypothetical protein
MGPEVTTNTPHCWSMRPAAVHNMHTPSHPPHVLPGCGQCGCFEVVGVLALRSAEGRVCQPSQHSTAQRASALLL